MSDGQGEAQKEVSSTADRRLPYDWCRCHDDECPKRETCLRWIDRMSGDPRTVHATTKREDSGECFSFVEVVR